MEFYRIALEGLKRARRLEKLAERRLQREELSEGDKDYTARLTGFAELGSIVSVVFSALSLEAFINDYANRRLSKSYFDNYLDKLDLVSKWIVIPLIITGSQIDTGSQGINNLRWLVRVRNELVHYKSKIKKVSEVGWEDWINLEDAEKSCETVPILVRELGKLDRSVQTDWLAPDYEMF